MVLSGLIKDGSLTVHWPGGKSDISGRGNPHATIRIKGALAPWTIGLRPDLVFGMSYMDGRIVPEDCSITDVLEILMLNIGEHRPPGIMRLRQWVQRGWRGISQFNLATRAQRNVAHHYDLDAGL
jgi:cyclopropane-fatty-acyl-phospholipid synthase